LLGSGVELVSRSEVVLVRDEAHARVVLRRHRDATDALGSRTDDDELERLARGLARGDLLLVRRGVERPLDPPHLDAVPLLSDLVEPGHDQPRTPDPEPDTS
jgi:hypothetical protein